MAPSRPLPKRVNPLLLPDETPARKAFEADQGESWRR
jgi:hypothetical protein